VKKKGFFNFPEAFWEIALYEVGNFIMKNNFLNNNGVNLHNTKNPPKTKVESQIDLLKQQEQAIITELD